jgi:hypothetical protein
MLVTMGHRRHSSRLMLHTVGVMTTAAATWSAGRPTPRGWRAQHADLSDQTLGEFVPHTK